MGKITEAVIIFCNPADAYRHLSESEAARKYKKLAFEDYDALVSFAPSYDPQKADLQKTVRWKRGKPIVETIFAEQPVVRIGNLEAYLISSSYLFNPQSDIKDVLLPDLDVAIFKGNKAMAGAKEVKELYEKAGWEVRFYQGEIKTVKLFSNRFPAGVPILDESSLLDLASRLTSYDAEKLCFKPNKPSQVRNHVLPS